MARPGWYMVCYDISHPKRLGKLYRIMKKNGISAQKSVFFVQRNEPDMKAFLKKLDRMIVKPESCPQAQRLYFWGENFPVKESEKNEPY